MNETKLHPDTAVKIFRRYLLFHCAYYDEYLDCDKCPKESQCCNIWDNFIGTIKEKHIEESKIEKIVNKRIALLSQSRLEINEIGCILDLKNESNR